ncbi:Helicase conserved C-terminal domain-containing protein [Thalassovita litoralis]|uniref:Helicase conserved C-terminal domain-containing protein n=1 Tax=Thalassovita litoralis TaxID=1010611 RepID=A0A521FTP2_9RHOB|nr:helicase-related protein [Thalassovita litoralis]SMO99496.1 Helicase conserved C-terminal domain-containing protein [Thalassovita litoralis]
MLGQPQWFVDEGYLTDFDYYAPFEPDLKGVGSRGGEYEQSALEEALERSKVFGNAVELFKRYAPENGTGVVFCCSKKHAELAAQAFNDAGIPADILLGEDQGEVRKDKLERLARGELRVLCAVDVISEGFDLPSIDVVLLLRPTQSFSLFRQQVGRVLRVIYAAGFDLSTRAGRLDAIAAGPKPRALVLDCAGNYHRHGHPLDDFFPTLEGADPERKKDTHTEDGDALSTRRCDECLQVIRSYLTVCPHCGTEHGPDPRVPASVAAEMRRVESVANTLHLCFYELHVVKRTDSPLRAILPRRFEQELAVSPASATIPLNLLGGQKTPLCWREPGLSTPGPEHPFQAL